MTDEPHKPSKPNTVRGVIRWTIRSVVLAVGLFVLWTGVLLTNRYQTNMTLLELAESHRKIDLNWERGFPFERREINRLAPWIGDHRTFALQHVAKDVQIHGHEQDGKFVEIPKEDILRLFAVSSGMKSILIFNRPLPDGALELIARRHAVERLFVDLPEILRAEDGRWLSQMRQLQDLHVDIPYEARGRTNDWSCLRSLPEQIKLSVRFYEANERDVKELAACPNLTSLSLSSTEKSDTWLNALCAAKRLEELSISNTETQLSLPDGKRLPASLKRLNVYGMNGGIESLSAIEGLPNLEHVVIYEGAISDAALETLARLPALRKVSFWGTLRISDTSFATLVNSLSDKSHLTDLRIHAKEGHEIDWLLPREKRLSPSLDRLELIRTNIDDAALAMIDGLPNLTKLAINGGIVTDAGLERLMLLPALECVDLANLPLVTDVTFKRLATKTSLTDVRVKGCGTTPLSFVWMNTLPNWEWLEYEDVRLQWHPGQIKPIVTEHNVDEFLSSQRNSRGRDDDSESE